MICVPVWHGLLGLFLHAGMYVYQPFIPFVSKPLLNIFEKKGYLVIISYYDIALSIRINWYHI